MTLSPITSTIITPPVLQLESSYEKLPNGFSFKIVNNPFPKNEAFFQLTLNVGSIHENASQIGFAQFLKEAVLKGTKNYSANQIQDFLNKNSITLNSSTSEIKTIFTLKSIPTSDIEIIKNALIILFEIIFLPVLDPVMMQKLKNDFFQIYSHEYSVDEYNRRAVLQILYPELKNSLEKFQHKEECIDTISMEKLRQFFITHYISNNTKLLIVGDLENKATELTNSVLEHFSVIKKQSNTKPFIHHHSLQPTILRLSYMPELHRKSRITFFVKKVILQHQDFIRRIKDHLEYFIFIEIFTKRLQSEFKTPHRFSIQNSLISSLDLFKSEIHQWSIEVSPKKSVWNVYRSFLKASKKFLLFGVSSDELDLAKSTSIADCKNKIIKIKANKLPSSELLNYHNTHLQLPSVKDWYLSAIQILEAMTENSINKQAQNLLNAPLTTLEIAEEGNEHEVFKKEIYKSIIEEVDKAHLQPKAPLDVLKSDFLIPRFPAGEICETIFLSNNAKKYVFANGVEFTHFQTDSQNEDLALRAIIPFEDSISAIERQSIQLFIQSGMAIAFENFNIDHLVNSYSNTIHNVPSIHYYPDSLQIFGGSESENTERLFQVFHKYFSQPLSDADKTCETHFNELKQELIQRNNSLLQSESILDQIAIVKMRLENKAIFTQDSEITFQKAYKAYLKLRNSGKLQFILIGNIEEEKLINLATTCIGSLPRKIQKEASKVTLEAPLDIAYIKKRQSISDLFFSFYSTTLDKNSKNILLTTLFKNFLQSYLNESLKKQRKIRCEIDVHHSLKMKTNHIGYFLYVYISTGGTNTQSEESIKEILEELLKDSEKITAYFNKERKKLVNEFQKISSEYELSKHIALYFPLDEKIDVENTVLLEYLRSISDVEITNFLTQYIRNFKSF